MMTNIVGCPPGEVHSGMAVTVSWEPLSDGRQLALFRPAGDGGRRERARGQARRGGPGHAARVVGGPDPRPPGAGHPARATAPTSDLNADINRLSRALRARGLRAGRRHRADVHQPPRVPRGPLRRPAHRPAPHAHQLAPHRGGGGLHRRELRGQGVRLLGRAGRQGRRRPPRRAGRAWSGSTRAATCPASRCTTRSSPPRTAPTSTTRSSAPRCSTPRAPPGRPKGVHRETAAVSALATVNFCGYDEDYEQQRRRPPPHRPALPRRPAGLLGGGALPLRRAHRGHGPLGPRRGAAPD